MAARAAQKDDRIVVYQKPTCTTCRQVHAALVEGGVDFDAVNYYTEPLSRATLKRLLKKLGLQARELLRTKEAIYKELGLASKDVPEQELIDLMVAHPDLIQRPIVERGEKAILARPASRIAEIL